MCVCLHQLLAHMVTHYGWHVTVSIFTPLSLIVAIHFFLLPANLLPHNFCCLGDIWYPDIWINPTALPPSSPSLTNSLFSSSHLSLCSVRVHPVHPFLRTANYLRVAEGSDSVKSLGACRCQHTWLTVTVLVVTCGSDPEIGFITCSLSFTEKKKYESNHGERSNSSNARTIWVSCLFWSAELAYGLNTCRAKAQTCRHRKQIWWTRQQRWHISVGGDWWNDLGA